jgi:hypothetical protein
MQDDNKPVQPAEQPVNPDTQILTELANQSTPTNPATAEPETIEKPQLGPVVIGGKKSHKKLWLSLLLLAILAAIGGLLYWHFVLDKPEATPAATTTKSQAVAKPKTTTQGLQLDTSKNYGNKYANGVLPVGDGKYDSAKATVGSVYTCAQYAQNFAKDQGGAGTRGPWFTNNNTQYDINKKAHVNGSVQWENVMTTRVLDGTRTINTNDLPNHVTGIFPIAAADPAYAYDKNPNYIKTQSFTYNLPASPTYGTPNCMGGEVGVMLTGVALFNAFDAGGRDAGAWEVQDSCGGHPQKSGEYHYHTLSSCIKDISVKSVIGYALDGFPITGPTVAPNNILTTSDLDECHGITSSYTLDGKTVTGYHYVMTQDFPYSVSCFRGTAIKPPGQP